MRRTVNLSLSLSLSLVAATVLLLTTGATSSAQPTKTSFMKVRHDHFARIRRTDNLSYHGGAIEQRAKVYIVY